MHLYLATYRGTGTEADPFTPSGSEVAGWSAIDLRPDPTQQAGRALLALPQRVDAPGREYLGDSPDDALPNAVRNALQNRLGVTLDGNEDRLRRIIPALLVKYAGGARWKPLQVDRDHRLRIWLGGLFWEQVVPAGGSTFTDDFNRANEVLTASPGNWVSLVGAANVVSNEAEATSGSPSTFMTALHVSSQTYNNYAQYRLVSATGTSTGVMCRVDSGGTSATTSGYLWRSTATVSTLFKDVNGTFTAISSDVATPFAAGDTIRVEANGSTINGLVNGSTLATVTDTAVTRGVRAAFRISDGPKLFDDFAAGDLAAVSAPRPRQQSTAVTGGATSLAVNKPAGVVAGDLLIAQVTMKLLVAGETISAPAGWTHMKTMEQAPGGAPVSYHTEVFYRVADGSEGASFTFSWTTSQKAVGAILRITGVDTTSPLNVVGSSTLVTSGTTRLGAGVTTTVANCLLLWITGEGNNGTHVPPVEMTEWWDHSSTNFNDVAQSGATETLGAAGATGDRSGTGTNASGGTFLVAIAPTPSGSTDLTVQDATHAHAADSPTLTQVHVLAVQDATHAHSADSPSLTQNHNLTVSDALHTHAVDSVTLTQGHVLTVADAVHGHTADSVTLTQTVQLVVADSVHDHTADSPVLTQAHTLTAADALHAHSADSVTLTVSTEVTLTVADTLHAHTVDTVTIFHIAPGDGTAAAGPVKVRVVGGGCDVAVVGSATRARVEGDPTSVLV